MKNSLPGNAPGYFSQSDIDTFRKTIEKALTKEDFENATNTFKTKINTVKEGQLYFIESTGPDYCRNKILYNTKPTAGASLRWGDKTTDENTLWEFIGKIRKVFVYEIKLPDVTILFSALTRMFPKPTFAP